MNICLRGRASTLFLALFALHGMGCEDDDAGKVGADTSPTDTSITNETTLSDDTAAIGQCELTHILSATTESCYNCMITRCCAQMQACDQDEDCVFCIDNPIDSSERCVDPSTFSVYPNRANLGACQTDECVPPCGADGGSSCSPSDCAWYCANHGSGCH